jgi:hypothetical protein
MSGSVFGALIRAEEMVEAGLFPAERLNRLRSALTTAFAAIGDAFFWNAMLPAAAVMGLFFSVFALPVGAVVFMLVFNAAHVWVRLWGFGAGYRRGLEVASAIDRLALPRRALTVRRFVAGGLGILAVCFPLGPFGPEWEGLKRFGFAVGVLGLILAASAVLKRGLPIEVLMAFLLGVSLLLGAVGVV